MPIDNCSFQADRYWPCQDHVDRLNPYFDLIRCKVPVCQTVSSVSSQVALPKFVNPIDSLLDDVRVNVPHLRPMFE